MKLVSLALFYLGSVSFFGAEAAARLDVASDSKRKWPRVRREATFAEAHAPPALLQAREVKGQPSRRAEDEGHIRLRRQDPNIFFHTHWRVVCKMQTCSVAKLADQLFHLNNKEKDPNAPPKKLSPHGYGRRRRRSVLDTLVALKSSSSSGRLFRQLASSGLFQP